MTCTIDSLCTAIRAVRLIVLATVLLVAAPGSHAQIPVVLDDVVVFARPGQTVQGVVREHGLPPAPKVLAMRDGRVVGEQAEARPVVLRNGVVVTPRARVKWGDDIEVRTRPDVIEPSRIETRTIEVPPTTVGRGVTPKSVAPGVAGVERLRVGDVSGDVLETEVVVKPQPGLARMVPAAGTPLVALTFDDGPWPVQTEAVLKVLAGRDVPATFFMLGSRVDLMPGVARAVTEAGHAVGNHTYRHTRLDCTTAVTAEWEIRATNWAITKATGTATKWLRPPRGGLDPSAQSYVAGAGMRTALWTVDPQDWRAEQTSATIAASVIAAVRPGAVVVLHDGGGDQSATIAALPVIIDRLRAAGYEFVTIDELPAVRAAW